MNIIRNKNSCFLNKRIFSIQAGIVFNIFTLILIYFSVQNAFVRITVQHSNGLDIFCQIIGWIYFIAWSISFYPQIYENWKRKRYAHNFWDIIIYFFMADLCLKTVTEVLYLLFFFFLQCDRFEF